MKKLYRKGTVHPSPPISEKRSLSYLPAAILTVAAALSPDDREVLAYLLSASAARFNFSHHHHPPSSSCYCFTCYTSFWARWDSSPNRHLIHQIIDALEDGFSEKREKKRNNKKNNKGFQQLNASEGTIGSNVGSDGPARVNPELGRADSQEKEGGQLGNGGEDTGENQGSSSSVRKIVSFIGERIWGTVWG